MKKVLFATHKGGAGKTTMCIILAQELKRLGKKVLSLDTDPQRNLSQFYGAEIDGQYTFADILYGDTPADNCIQHTELGDIIPSDTALLGAESKAGEGALRYLHLKKSFEGFKSDYDYLIIDTPPAIGIILTNAMLFADELIVPVQESGWSLSGLMDLHDAIQDAKYAGNESLKVLGLVTVMAQERTHKSAEIGAMAKEIASAMDTEVFSTKIRSSVKIGEAFTVRRRPIYEISPKSKISKDCENFTIEFLDKEKKL